MAAAPQTVSHGQIFAIAWPIILANASTPLTGIVDTAVIGQLGEAHLLGAIAVGALVFNFLYWGFGFLRMGTTGLTAQALGAENEEELKASLLRAALLGGVCGLALIVLRDGLSWGAFALLNASEGVEDAAKDYVAIRIWGAPAALATYGAMGWFIGQGESRRVLIVTLSLNGLNAGLDAWFVLGLGWGVTGVAVGTVIAEWAAAGLALILALGLWRRRTVLRGRTAITRARLLEPEALLRMFATNRDILLRTLLLITAFAWFTSEGAATGDVTLAANHILLQFVSFAAFFLDGFAFAAEALVGRAVGARSPSLLAASVRRSTHLAFGAAVLISLGYAVWGGAAIDALTPDPELRAAARAFLIYAIAEPVIAVWCFQYDGIFIGATRTREMRNAMFISFAVYIALWAVLTGPFGNHGLWIAFMIFFALRGLTLWALYGSVRRAAQTGVAGLAPEAPAQ